MGIMEIIINLFNTIFSRGIPSKSNDIVCIPVKETNTYEVKHSDNGRVNILITGGTNIIQVSTDLRSNTAPRVYEVVKNSNW